MNKGGEVGYLVEYDHTNTICGNPDQEATKNYVSGRFGWVSLRINNNDFLLQEIQTPSH